MSTATASKPAAASSIKAARKDLNDKVRDDWSYDGKQSNLPLRSNPIIYSIADERVVAWREPYYASSDSSDGETGSGSTRGPNAKTRSRRPQKPAGSSVADRLKRGGRKIFGKGSAEESESDAAPATTAGAAETTTADADGKKRLRFQDEAGWNGGVEHFDRQREAWTCARDGASEQTKAGATVDTSESSDDKSDKGSHRSSASSAPSPSATKKPQFPVAAPVLPESDPARIAAAAAGAHESIYEKVIVQSRAPAVPINLAHVVRALVHGWKADGSWPAP